MNVTDLNTTSLTSTAIAALKNAYEGCGDRVVKESITDAYKAILQLHYDLEVYIKFVSSRESDRSIDASEYCAAV